MSNKAKPGAQKNYNDASSNILAQGTNFWENQGRTYYGRKDSLNSIYIQTGINQQSAPKQVKQSAPKQVKQSAPKHNNH